MKRPKSLLMSALFCMVPLSVLLAQSWPTRPATLNGVGTCCTATGQSGCCPTTLNNCITVGGKCTGIGMYQSIKPNLVVLMASVNLISTYSLTALPMMNSTAVDRMCIGMTVARQ